MSTTLTAGPDIIIASWDYEQSQSYGSNSVQAGRFQYGRTSLINGTDAGQANRVHLAQLVINPASSTTINCFALPDPVSSGVTNTMGVLKGLYIELSALCTASSILLGGASLPLANWVVPATAQVRLRNGMCLYLGLCQDTTGYAVGSGFNLKLANEDAVNTAVVNVRLVGSSRPSGLSLDFSNPFDSTYLPLFSNGL